MLGVVKKAKDYFRKWLKEGRIEGVGAGVMNVGDGVRSVEA